MLHRASTSLRRASVSGLAETDLVMDFLCIVANYVNPKSRFYQRPGFMQACLSSEPNQWVVVGHASAQCDDTVIIDPLNGQ